MGQVQPQTNSKQANGLAQMNEKQFIKLAEVITSKFGIKMPLDKKAMLEARIRRRLRALKINNFTAYFDLLFSDQGWQREVVYMIDAVTTNKTEFFRESHHFDTMASLALPSFAANIQQVKRPLRVWSAGCSSGAEPYTICMVIEEFKLNGNGNRNISYQIIASDLSTEMLKIAKKGIYEAAIIDPVAVHLRKKYFLKSKAGNHDLVRIVPELRKKIQYYRLNLMDAKYGFKEQMDIIFCRNVMIYFDRKTQQQLIGRFKDNLRPGGYLFIGHSESLAMEGSSFTRVGSTVYQNC